MKEFNTNFTRSKFIESSHKIKLLVKNLDGKTLLTTSNNEDMVYPRSAIKIFQAIPFIKSNAVEYYKLNSKIIALACSSHRGEDFHIKELKKWIKKLNINKKKLKCGIHNPINTKATENLFRSNNIANELHNNCAGKHLAMISSCKILKHNIESYLNFNHPHQKSIRNIFEKFSNSKISKSSYGTDGCSAPQYAFKIKEITQMLINLVRSYHNQFDYSNEVKLLIESITNNPKYIGGSDSLDSRLMEITKNKLFCKGGAEGVFLFAHLEKGIVGIIKVVDGNERAIPDEIYNLFKKIKILKNFELNELEKTYKFKIINHAKIVTGKIETTI